MLQFYMRTFGVCEETGGDFASAQFEAFGETCTNAGGRVGRPRLRYKELENIGEAYGGKES